MVPQYQRTTTQKEKKTEPPPLTLIKLSNLDYTSDIRLKEYPELRMMHEDGISG